MAKKEAKDGCRVGPPPGNVTVCVRSRKRKLPRVTNAVDLCKVVRKAVGVDRESFYGVALNSQLDVLGVEEVAKGQVDGVNVHPRELFKSAILQGASNIAFAHNHPSGSLEPSPEDIDLTKRMKHAGKILGIPVIDHLIVGAGGKCTSLAESTDLFGAADSLGKAYKLPKPSEGAQTIRDQKK
jgi:DNA repair protein RadC